MCLVGPYTFVPLNRFAKKHGAVPHSSTEAEVFSFDAALRMLGLPVLALWDLVIEILGDRKVTNSVLASTGRPAAEQAKKIQPKVVDPVYSVFDNIDYIPYGMILPAAKASCSSWRTMKRS